MTPWQTSTDIIRRKAPNVRPKIGFILGSGLGELTTILDNKQIISYSDLSNFPQCGVAGHDGNLVLGTIAGLSIACLQGRAHFYEGYSHLSTQKPNEVLLTPIRTLKQLGCEVLFITNAVGSLDYAVKPGELVVINDHINYQFNNPLTGLLHDEFGSTFVGMENAYDSELRQLILTSAKANHMTVTEGVYIGVLGPSFETPAEIRAFRQWGANVVGMSSVAEVIVARHCQLRVVAVSMVTNLAAGMSEQVLSHEITLRNAQLGLDKMTQLVQQFVGQYQSIACKV